jgi:hypothetical protein
VRRCESTADIALMAGEAEAIGGSCPRNSLDSYHYRYGGAWRGTLVHEYLHYYRIRWRILQEKWWLQLMQLLYWCQPGWDRATKACVEISRESTDRIARTIAEEGQEKGWTPYWDALRRWWP